MGANNPPEQDELRVFHTGDHACGYWPTRIARDLSWIRAIPRMPDLYPMALGWGFRRSGDIVYRPHCQGCRACVAVRIPVERLRTRSQPAPLPQAQRAGRSAHRSRPNAPTSNCALPALPACAPPRSAAWTNMAAWNSTSS
jgi:arginine-tRNA-protein transferase